MDIEKQDTNSISEQPSLKTASHDQSNSSDPNRIFDESRNSHSVAESKISDSVELLIDNLPQLYKTHADKFYQSGLVYMRNPVSKTGSLRYSPWEKYWMEIVGLELHLWLIPDLVCHAILSARLGTEMSLALEVDPPLLFIEAAKTGAYTCISINDVIDEVFTKESSEIILRDSGKVDFIPEIPCPPVPYTSFFGISVQSSNLLLFASYSTIQCNNWVAAFRLTRLETSKLEKLHMWNVLNTPMYLSFWSTFGIYPYTSLEFRGSVKFEGKIYVKLQYSTIYQKYWAVVTSKHHEQGADHRHSIAQKMFGSKRQDFAERGTITFYAKRKEAPIFSIVQCSGLSVFDSKTKSTENLVNDDSKEEEPDNSGVSLMHCVIKGKIKLPLKHQVPNDPTFQPPLSRTLAGFQSGFPIIDSSTIQNLIIGKDARIIPNQVTFHTKNSDEMGKWIVAIMGSFSISSDSSNDLTTISESSKVCDRIGYSPLYLSVSEVSSIRMQSPAAETDGFFEQFITLKTSFSSQDKIRDWGAFVAKGEWERNLMSRRETAFKINKFREWVKKIDEILVLAGAKISRYNLNELRKIAVTGVTEYAGALAAVLCDIAAPQKLATVTPQAHEGIKDDSTGDDGSVSMSDNSSEGSLSEAASMISATLDPVTKKQAQSDAESFVSAPSDYNPNGIYEYNSLIHQLATEGKKTNIKSGANVLIDAIKVQEDLRPEQIASGNLVDNLFIQNSLLQRQSVVPLVAKQSNSGPLLGTVNPGADKPKLVSGLLGEVSRRELDRKYKVRPEDYLRELERQAIARERMHQNGESHPIDLCSQLSNLMQHTAMDQQLMSTIGKKLISLINQLSIVQACQSNHPLSTLYSHQPEMFAKMTSDDGSYLESHRSGDNRNALLSVPSQSASGSHKSASTGYATSTEIGTSGTDSHRSGSYAASSVQSTDDDDLLLGTLKDKVSSTESSDASSSDSDKPLAIISIVNSKQANPGQYQMRDTKRASAAILNEAIRVDLNDRESLGAYSNPGTSYGPSMYPYLPTKKVNDADALQSSTHRPSVSSYLSTNYTRSSFVNDVNARQASPQRPSISPYLPPSASLNSDRSLRFPAQAASRASLSQNLPSSHKADKNFASPRTFSGNRRSISPCSAAELNDTIRSELSSRMISPHESMSTVGNTRPSISQPGISFEVPKFPRIQQKADISGANEVSLQSLYIDSLPTSPTTGLKSLPKVATVITTKEPVKSQSSNNNASFSSVPLGIPDSDSSIPIRSILKQSKKTLVQSSDEGSVSDESC